METRIKNFFYLCLVVFLVHLNEHQVHTYKHMWPQQPEESIKPLLLDLGSCGLPDVGAGNQGPL